MQKEVKIVYPKVNKKKLQALVRNAFPGFFEWSYHLNHQRKDRHYFRQQKAAFEQISQHTQVPSHIEIETLNRCNSTCEFCPVNRNDDPREMIRMSDELFYKIIDDLGEIEYSGTLNLFSNNEPFLDKRIEKFAAYTRQKLPNAYIQIISNGTALTVKKVLDVMPNISYLVINNYAFEMRLHDNVQEIYESISKDHPEYAAKLNIGYRLLTEFKTTRAGNSPNRNKRSQQPVYVSRCAYPYFQMVIRPDGKLSLCCNDALGQMTMGDVSKESILSAWNHPQRKKLQDQMMQGRSDIELCNKCDNLGWAKPNRVLELSQKYSSKFPAGKAPTG